MRVVATRDSTVKLRDRVFMFSKLASIRVLVVSWFV